jgi:predicted nucleotidyltransferase
MAPSVTLLDLVTAVAKYARSDEEVIATVAYMVSGGRVRLCGNFKGARFDLDALADNVAA